MMWDKCLAPYGRDCYLFGYAGFPHCSEKQSLTVGCTNVPTPETPVPCRLADREVGSCDVDWVVSMCWQESSFKCLTPALLPFLSSLWTWCWSICLLWPPGRRELCPMEVGGWEGTQVPGDHGVTTPAYLCTLSCVRRKDLAQNNCILCVYCEKLNSIPSGYTQETLVLFVLLFSLSIISLMLWDCLLFGPKPSRGWSVPPLQSLSRSGSNRKEMQLPQTRAVTCCHKVPGTTLAGAWRGIFLLVVHQCADYFCDLQERVLIQRRLHMICVWWTYLSALL